MYLKKFVSLSLILAQLSIIPSFASPTQTTAPSPEFTFVENLQALQGEGLSQSQLQQQIIQIGKTYLGSAPAQGQTERLEQALVDTGMYTLAQAQSFIADSTLAASQLGENATPDQTNKAIINLVSSHPAGAQFSGCGLAMAGELIGGIGGVMAMLAGLVGQDGSNYCEEPGVYVASQGIPECGTPAGNAAAQAGKSKAGIYIISGVGAFFALVLPSVIYRDNNDC